MTGDQRRLLAAEAGPAATAVADALTAQPLRAGRPYPIGTLLPVLAAQHARLVAALDRCPGPVAVDEAGRTDQFGVDVAGLTGYLQLFLALYKGLDEIPAPMRVEAGRLVPNVHQLARRVRDGAGKPAG